MFIVFILLAFLIGVPLYLDYKKNPDDNITKRIVDRLSDDPKLKPILDKIEPHTSKHGVKPIYVLGGGAFLLLIIIIAIL
jgi:hypothetical protein